MVTIERLTEATDVAAADLRTLSSALHGDERHVSRHELEEITHDPNIVLMVARNENKIIGMGAIYVIRKIGNRKVYIEDIIVDEAYRNQGIGGKLMNALIEAAQGFGARSAELMTRTDRKDAHRFYEKLGFVNKNRYVYKLEL